MALTVNDMTKAGWQKKREKFTELKASGVGEALETYKMFFAKGDRLPPQDWDNALKKGLLVTKALGVAKKKAEAIKDARKSAALQVVKLYEQTVAEFADDILTKMDQAKRLREAERRREQFIQSIKPDNVLGDGALLKVFRAYAAGPEQSTEVVEAAILWKQKKYKECVLKYGKDNEWNQHGGYTKQLLDHYSGTKLLPDKDLQTVQGFIEFEQMVWGNNSLFTRFLKSKDLADYAKTKFPA